MKISFKKKWKSTFQYVVALKSLVYLMKFTYLICDKFALHPDHNEVKGEALFYDTYIKRNNKKQTILIKKIK